MSLVVNIHTSVKSHLFIAGKMQLFVASKTYYKQWQNVELCRNAEHRGNEILPLLITLVLIN